MEFELGKVFHFILLYSPGFTGENCKCDLNMQNVDEESDLDDNCMADGSNIICSGRGKCRCGQCQCDEGYVGKFCKCSKDECPKGKTGT